MIRKATIEDAAAIAKVHVDSWRTTYKGIISETFLQNLSYDQRTTLWQKHLAENIQTVFVAENDEKEVVGFISGGKRTSNKEPDATDLTAIYIFKAYQGKNLGKQLLKKMMELYQEQGYKKVYVEVLTENPARNFYEHTGAVYVKTVKIQIAGDTLDEDIYVWNDIEATLQELQ